MRRHVDNIDNRKVFVLVEVYLLSDKLFNFETWKKNKK